jgi:hypothetical protein
MPVPHAFPQSEASDSDNVADALDSGLLHWVKGETAEALRCLLLARSAAEDGGDGQRAVALARAAAELAPDGARDPSASMESPAPGSPAAPAATIAQPSNGATDSAEPRRSKLPEAPAPLKKFTGSSDSAPAAATKAQAQLSGSIAPKSQHSSSAASVAPKPGANGAGASFRPSPPSARPSSTTTGSVPSGDQTSSTDNASTRPNDDHAKPDQSKGEVALAKPEGSVAGGSRTAQVRSPSSTSASESRARVSHASAVPHEQRAPDVRLASLRVKVERVESDGYLRVRLLDLAATASGEDNALLVISQSLWQELKRGS